MLVSLGTHQSMASTLRVLQSVYYELGVQSIMISSPSEDSCFLRDSSACTPFGLIKCNMGKESRTWEPDHVFQQLGCDPVITLTGDETFEGADLLWIDDATAILAEGCRTNKKAANRIDAWLRYNGVRVVRVNLPKWHDQHLLGVCNSINGRVYAVENFAVDPMAGAWLEKELSQYVVPLTLLPQSEYKLKGPNWVNVGKNRVVGALDTIRTRDILDQDGIEYHGVDIKALRNHGGGVACATGVVSNVCATVVVSNV